MHLLSLYLQAECFFTPEQVLGGKLAKLKQVFDKEEQQRLLEFQLY